MSMLCSQLWSPNAICILKIALDIFFSLLLTDVMLKSEINYFAKEFYLDSDTTVSGIKHS